MNTERFDIRFGEGPEGTGCVGTVPARVDTSTAIDIPAMDALIELIDVNLECLQITSGASAERIAEFRELIRTRYAAAKGEFEPDELTEPIPPVKFGRDAGTWLLGFGAGFVTCIFLVVAFFLGAGVSR